MIDPTIAFLERLGAVLAADKGLGDLIASGRGAALSAPYPVYLDAAPPDEAFPYLTYSVATDNAWNDSDDQPGAELLIDVHVWTQGAGSAPNRYLQRRVREVCTDPAWDLTGLRLVYCRPERARTDPDEGGFHGVVTLRALIGS